MTDYSKYHSKDGKIFYNGTEVKLYLTVYISEENRRNNRTMVPYEKFLGLIECRDVKQSSEDLIGESWYEDPAFDGRLKVSSKGRVVLDGELMGAKDERLRWNYFRGNLRWNLRMSKGKWKQVTAWPQVFRAKNPGVVLPRTVKYLDGNYDNVDYNNFKIPIMGRPEKNGKMTCIPEDALAELIDYNVRLKKECDERIKCLEDELNKIKKYI